MSLQPERLFRNDRCATVAAQQTFRVVRMFRRTSGNWVDVWRRSRPRQPAIFFNHLFFLFHRGASNEHRSTDL